MKHSISSLLLLFAATNCFAQHNKLAPLAKSSYSINYDDVSVGRNINLIYHRKLSAKWSIYGGIKYQFNSPHFKNDYTTYAPYFKEYEAKGLWQRLGIKLGIEANLYRNENCELFGFYDAQFSNAFITTKYLAFVSDNYHNEIKPFTYGVGTDRMYSLENALGLGAKIKMTDHLRFRIKAGLGFNYFWSDAPFNSFRDLGQGGNRRLPMPPNRIISAGFEYAIAPTNTLKTTTSLHQQKSAIRLSYNNTQIGRSLSVGVSVPVLPHTRIYSETSFFINSKAFVDYEKRFESYYHKQFVANRWQQHLGLKAGVEHIFYQPNNNFNLFGFYEAHISQMDIRNFVWTAYFSSGITRAAEVAVFNPKKDLIEPKELVYRRCKDVTSLEHSVGLGMRLAVSNKIAARVNAGLGYNFYFGANKYEPYTVTYPPYYSIGSATTVHYNDVKFDAPKSEISKMFSLGIEYKL